MLAVAFLAMLPAPTLEVGTYFPLATGTTWTYEDVNEAGSQTYVDSVGNEQEVGGLKAWPIVTKFGNKIDGSTFYRIDGDEVLVVAFDQNKPLPAPYPIIKLGSGKNAWEYKGTTQWIGDEAPLNIKGTCKRAGSKELFGSKHEVIEVVLDASIGPKGSAGLKSHQVSLYASDIGLIELKDTTTVNKRKTVKTRTLIAFKAGRAN